MKKEVDGVGVCRRLVFSPTSCVLATLAVFRRIATILRQLSGFIRAGFPQRQPGKASIRTGLYQNPNG